MGLEIQSKEVIDKISDDLKVQPALKIPRELMEKIQLIYNINPERRVQVKSKDVSDDASEIIFTASATKRTFIIASNLSVSKDVLAPSIATSLLIVPLGAATTVLNTIRYEPLTVGAFVSNLALPIPLELEKGSVVTLTNTSATGSIDTTSNIFIFEADPQ